MCVQATARQDRAEAKKGTEIKMKMGKKAIGPQSRAQILYPLCHFNSWKNDDGRTSD
jgi:hypothetical protein